MLIVINLIAMESARLAHNLQFLTAALSSSVKPKFFFTFCVYRRPLMNVFYAKFGTRLSWGLLLCSSHGPGKLIVCFTINTCKFTVVEGEWIFLHVCVCVYVRKCIQVLRLYYLSKKTNKSVCLVYHWFTRKVWVRTSSHLKHLVFHPCVLYIIILKLSHKIRSLLVLIFHLFFLNFVYRVVF